MEKVTGTKAKNGKSTTRNWLGKEQKGSTKKTFSPRALTPYVVNQEKKKKKPFTPNSRRIDKRISQAEEKTWGNYLKGTVGWWG